ncbi:MAG: prepilin-type N-terminal cleavage/methylation domain-containing protein [Solirubrobacteraceae bacterium]
MKREEGFTMIELLLALLIVAIVIGALTDGFVNANDSSLSSQRTISRFSVLQQQIERIHQIEAQNGFVGIALSSAPIAGCSTATVDPTSPSAFVCGSGCSETFSVQSNYNLTSESFPSASTIADSPESLLVDGCTVSGVSVSGGRLAPVQYADLSTGTTYASLSGVPTGDGYATVYTFVTATSTSGCNTSLGSCTGDVRRVIVAVVLGGQGADIGPNYPSYSTTVFVNPAASNQPGAPSGLKLLGYIS